MNNPVNKLVYTSDGIYIFNGLEIKKNSETSYRVVMFIDSNLKHAINVISTQDVTIARRYVADLFNLFSGKYDQRSVNLEDFNTNFKEKYKLDEYQDSCNNECSECNLCCCKNRNLGI